MNTTEFKRKLIKEFGIHYTKEEVLICLERLKPLEVFDMLCEDGLCFMDDMVEHVACYILELQAKEKKQSTWEWEKHEKHEEEHGDVSFVLAPTYD